MVLDNISQIRQVTREADNCFLDYFGVQFGPGQYLFTLMFILGAQVSKQWKLDKDIAEILLLHVSGLQDLDSGLVKVFEALREGVNHAFRRVDLLNQVSVALLRARY